MTRPPDNLLTRPTRAEVAKKSYLALVHHPVYDKHGLVVATSITNLDIHDIARSSRTYGLAGYFIVHPVTAQRELAGRILQHWNGPGQEQNEFRSSALTTVRVVASLDQAMDQIAGEQGHPPLIAATTARKQEKAIATKRLLKDPELAERPLLLLFGTGWGLAKEVLERTDRLLQPICGPSDYNHLSVRSAAGIILDRLFGEPEHDSGEQTP